MSKKKQKMTKKQEKTLEGMKKTRQLDSQNLRELIEQKLKWAEAEKLKGLKQVEQLKVQIYRLEGIILFIRDLLEPEEKKEEK